VAANGAGVRYDAHLDRWLPRGLPTPDGTGYVYGDDAGNVHRVALRSGQDTVILRGQWSPLAFIGDRLYLAEAPPSAPSAFGGGGYGPGRLARTDLTGGQPTLVTQQVGFWSVSSLGGWTLDRADGSKLAPPDRVLHLDLATGLLAPWLSAVPYVAELGFDAAGHPFLVIDHQSVRVLLLIDKGDAREVYSGPRQAGAPEAPFVVDGGKVWFSGSSATEPTFEAPVWLYRPGLGLGPSVSVPGAQVSVAGGCA
jgi:hypothetical protein